jgi:hypothetical protein
LNRVKAAAGVGRWQTTRRVLLALVALGAASTVFGRNLAQDPPPVGETQRLEGEAILNLADAALAGKATPTDFQVQWQNEFLKAQRGIFIPFTLTVDVSGLTRPEVLVYVRALRRTSADEAGKRETRKRSRRESGVEPDGFAVDAIFPAELQLEPGQRARISRGFSVGPGSYDVYVVVRERLVPGDRGFVPKAAVLKQPLEVPDLSTTALTTSSVILADRLETLPEPIGPDDLPERPYVIGQNEITPAADRRFRNNEELVVVFLIYNPFVTSQKKFDLQVEYHFFRRGTGAPRGPAPGQAAGSHPPEQEGERYFNHTDPQRFNPVTLGASFDPATGQPVLAGQGVPLTGFEAGEYRLAIRITDLLAGTSIMRDVHFTVGS